MIATRIGKAGGGSVPLLGGPVTENFEEDESGNQRRTFQPYTPTDPNLPATVGHNQPPAQLLAPVYKSVTHDLLADPQALGGMKQGNPQQWLNALTKAGAKKEEMQWLGVGEGEPNAKLPREMVLARAKERLPKISDKMLGEHSKERVLISGDPDEEEEPEYSLQWSNRQTEEPDSDYIYERAKERIADEIDEKTADPDQMEEHVPEVLDKYADKWLRDSYKDKEGYNTALFRPERMAGFAKEAVKNGWALPEKADKVIQQAGRGKVDGKDWNDFVNHTIDGFGNAFNREPGEEEEHPSLPLEGLDPLPSKTPSDTEGYLTPFNDAVLRLHGHAVDTDKLPTLGDSATVPDSAHAGRGQRQPKPDLHDDLQEHVSDKLQEEYEDEERRYYYDDAESPWEANVTVSGADGEPDYTVRGSYGEYYVHDPRGRRLGSTHSEAEAEQMILDHAMENYPGGGENGAVYEDRDIPQGNIETPEAQGRAKYQSYALPGMINYREVPISFEPRPGDPDFSRSHYDTNTLGHMRVGEVRDEHDHRLLHLDEIQSDWHQKGNDEGYLTPEAKTRRVEQENQYKAHLEALEHSRSFFADAFGMTSDEEGHKTANRAYGEQDRRTSPGSIVADIVGRENDIHADRIYGERLLDALSDETKKKLFGDDWENMQFNTIPPKIREMAKEKWGDDAQEQAETLENTANAARTARRAMAEESNKIPDAPWKDTGDFGRLAIRRAIRMAADYGYDGISLSPGWVQNDRWAGQDHKHLYDNIFRGSLEGVASEANRHAKTNLKREETNIPVLKSHANSRGKGEGLAGKAHALIFGEGDADKIRKNSLPLFKRGGAATAKDARRAVIIAKGIRSTRAEGGRIGPPLLGGAQTEAIYEAEGTQTPTRTYLPPMSPEEAQQQVYPSKLISAKPANPVFKSVTHSALSDPNALNQMKMGTPPQWMKALKRAGAKPWELEWMGIGQGEPNVKVPREEMLARAQANLPKLSEGMMGSTSHKVLSTEPPPAPEYEVQFGEWKKKQADYDWIDKERRKALENIVKEKVNTPLSFDDYHVSSVLGSVAKNHLKVRGNESYYDFEPVYEEDVRGVNPLAIKPDRATGFINTAVSHGWALPEKANAALNDIKTTGRIGPHSWNDFVNDMHSGITEKIKSKTPESQTVALPGMTIEQSDGDKIATPGSELGKHDEAVAKLYGYAKDEAPKGMQSLHYLKARLADENVGEADRQAYIEHEKRTDIPSVARGRVKEKHAGDEHSGYIATRTPEGQITITSPHRRPITSGNTGDEVFTDLRQANDAILSDALQNYNFAKPEVEQTTHQVPPGNIGYRIPYVKNYRELAFQFQPKGERPEAIQTHYSGYGYPHTLFHTRFGDLNDAKGKRVLFVDELQSDWLQKGMNGGFATAAPGEIERLINQRSDILRRHGSTEDREEQARLATQYHALGNRIELLESGIPKPPYTDTAAMARPALWRMMRIAADHGYDGIALSPGWVQRMRWVASDKGHEHLYDGIYGGAFQKLAKSHGLQAQMAEYPGLKLHAQKKEMPDAEHRGRALTVYMGPEEREMIRRTSYGLKTGGRAVNHEPTEAQKEAGNYKKKHLSFQGLNIAIENEKGSTRSGVGAGGKRWSCTVPADYGYIKGTEGADGDHVDAYIGPDHESTHVFIINQTNLKSGKFDEHKVILGCRTEREAADLYASGFSDGKGRQRIASMESMSMDAFKRWLKSGNTTKRAAAHHIVSHALGLTKKYLYNASK